MHCRKARDTVDRAIKKHEMKNAEESLIVEVLGVSADVLIRDSVPSASHVADDELSKKLSKLTPGQKKAAIDILNAYTDNIPYITKR